jgi:hydrogenase 3 maturation protease
MGRVEINNRSKVKGQRSKVKIVDPGSRIQDLASKFKGRVVMIGVGNPLKGDDGAGPFFIRGLSQICGRSRRIGTVPVLVDAGEVPENYTGAVTKAKPDTVVIVDAADFSGKPGEIKIFRAEEISGAGLATHSMSLGVFTEYLKQETGAEIFLLAIQPKAVKPGASLSKEVKSSINNLIKMLA